MTAGVASVGDVAMAAGPSALWSTTKGFAQHPGIVDVILVARSRSHS